MALTRRRGGDRMRGWRRGGAAIAVVSLSGQWAVHGQHVTALGALGCGEECVDVHSVSGRRSPKSEHLALKCVRPNLGVARVGSPTASAEHTQANPRIRVSVGGGQWERKRAPTRATVGACGAAQAARRRQGGGAACARASPLFSLRALAPLLPLSISRGSSRHAFGRPLCGSLSPGLGRTRPSEAKT